MGKNLEGRLSGLESELVIGVPMSRADCQRYFLMNLERLTKDDPGEYTEADWQWFKQIDKGECHKLMDIYAEQDWKRR
jgi:hypothetical protein